MVVRRLWAAGRAASRLPASPPRAPGAFLQRAEAITVSVLHLPFGKLPFCFDWALGGLEYRLQHLLA